MLWETVTQHYDKTTTESGPGVTRTKTLGVAPPSKVVGLSVEHETQAPDEIFPIGIQGNVVVEDVDVDLPLIVSQNIAEVSSVSVCISGTSVLLLKRVKMSSSIFTSVAQEAPFMDVEAMRSRRDVVDYPFYVDAMFVTI